jgi:hypothetical protein
MTDDAESNTSDDPLMPPPWANDKADLSAEVVMQEILGRAFNPPPDLPPSADYIGEYQRAFANQQVYLALVDQYGERIDALKRLVFTVGFVAFAIGLAAGRYFL